MMAISKHIKIFMQFSCLTTDKLAHLYGCSCTFIRCLALPPLSRGRFSLTRVLGDRMADSFRSFARTKAKDRSLFIARCRVPRRFQLRIAVE